MKRVFFRTTLLFTLQHSSPIDVALRLRAQCIRLDAAENDDSSPSSTCLVCLDGVFSSSLARTRRIKCPSCTAVYHAGCLVSPTVNQNRLAHDLDSYYYSIFPQILIERKILFCL
jgi:hypothetical protein